MKKISTFVPVTLAGVLFAAMVLAAPLGTETQGKPAKAPNRADVFAVAICADPAVTPASQAQSWHNALGSKRVHDRALILASSNPDLAKGCKQAAE
jgi:hypothetical protein